MTRVARHKISILEFISLAVIARQVNRVMGTPISLREADSIKMSHATGVHCVWHFVTVPGNLQFLIDVLSVHDCHYKKKNFNNMFFASIIIGRRVIFSLHHNLRFGPVIYVYIFKYLQITDY